ncbi:MAG: orotidine-5'-phosphate decarboxylase [Pyrinomonadaceae bacterium]
MKAARADKRIAVDERLIVALDVESAEKAREAVKELEGLITTFKVGLQLYSAAGPDLVRELVEAGNKVFLDLKFHDIPNTVAQAAVEAAKCGVWMFNVHASGGREMMKRTLGDVSEFCQSNGADRPHIIAVTVLTSFNDADADETGVRGNVSGHVERLARLASSCGLDGVVASAVELEMIRSAVPDPHFRIVTPGIRFKDETNDDQKRVMTPGAALAAGSDHLVIGRPILGAADKRAAATKIVDELKRHL